MAEMKYKPEYGDLVVMDNGLNYLIGVWKNGGVWYSEIEDDGRVIMGSIHSVSEDYEVSDDCVLLERNFESPLKTCDKCGSYGFLT